MKNIEKPGTQAWRDFEEDMDLHASEGMADACLSRMAKKREEGQHGWYDKSLCSQQKLSNLLHDAVRRGSLVGIANYTAFLLARDETLLEEKPE